MPRLWLPTRQFIDGEAMSEDNHTTFPWLTGLTEDQLSTRRGFVFQYPPFPLWEMCDSKGFLETGDPVGLYLHVPFCHYKCSYCYYVISIGRSDDDVERYLNLLAREMDILLPRLGSAYRKITTVYVGGGTPTYLNERQIEFLIEQVHKRFDLSSLVEFTFESDPTSVTPNKLRLLRSLGVNRLSLGVQTFISELNLANGRQHTAEDALRAINDAREAGFDNLNIDLICGLLGETRETWAQSIDRLLSISPEHATIYLLSVRPKTITYRNTNRTPSQIVPDEKGRTDMYLFAQESLERNGYIQTSPNCYARELQYEQVHQANAWSCNPLLGFGVSAYSYIDGFLYQNTRNIPTYLKQINDRQPAVEKAHRLNAQEQMVRYIILRLKLLCVIRSDFQHRFGLDMLDIFGDVVERLEALGLVKVTEEQCSLTTKGIVYVDDVCRSFYTQKHSQQLSNIEVKDSLVASMV